MKHHTTDAPHNADNVFLVDVSDLRDPNRALLRNLGSGDCVLLRVALRNDRGATDVVDMSAHISRATGRWPDRWFVGLLQPYVKQRSAIYASRENGFVAFRPRHILEAFPQPSERWEDTADDLRTALIETLVRKTGPDGLPSDVIFSTMQKMIDNQGAVLAEMAELLEREVE